VTCLSANSGGDASTCSLHHTSLSKARAVRKSTRARPVTRRAAFRTSRYPIQKLPRPPKATDRFSRFRHDGMDFSLIFRCYGDGTRRNGSFAIFDYQWGF
jgi:hypothetical protein